MDRSKGHTWSAQRSTSSVLLTRPGPFSKTATKSAGSTRGAPLRRPRYIQSSVQRAVKSDHDAAIRASRKSGQGQFAEPLAQRMTTAAIASMQPQRAARKTTRSTIESSDEDSDSDASMEEYADDDMYSDTPRPLKAARKVEVGSNLARKSARPAKAARKIEVEAIYVSSDSEEPPPSDSDEDHDALLKAFEALTIPTLLHVDKRLPFLRRNLRTGFLNRCEEEGIRTLPKDEPAQPLRVIYRFRPDADDESDTSESSTDEDDWEEDVGETRKWECPVCDIFGVMNTREMLVFHLEGHHREEIDTSWEDLGDGQWQLTVSQKSTHTETQDDQAEAEDSEVIPSVCVFDRGPFGLYTTEYHDTQETRFKIVVHL
ncbi:hypothetical protein NM688_g8293 [Phlebia brevispora]|uniref:Uncharacterized protein n=1 Tax=Phlebia brevispora TaxID=194682 RepID=A0ACC1RUS9_9APHY|nr:hypothetical protein NM688_g8293 [Phlebia brevispora]